MASPSPKRGSGVRIKEQPVCISPASQHAVGSVSQSRLHRKSPHRRSSTSSSLHARRQRTLGTCASLEKVGTLFGGDHHTNPALKRSSAVIFRKPNTRSTKAHQRPIFVRGLEGVDARDCVDVHEPCNFHSGKRAVWERAYNQGCSNGFNTVGFRIDTPSRPLSVASSAGTGSSSLGRSRSCGVVF